MVFNVWLTGFEALWSASLIQRTLVDKCAYSGNVLLHLGYMNFPSNVNKCLPRWGTGDGNGSAKANLENNSFTAYV